MSYTLHIQVDAQEDLREAWAYYESQQTGLGLKFMAAFLECAVQIEGNPFLFQKFYKQKRRAVVRPFGYNVFYEVVRATPFVFRPSCTAAVIPNVGRKESEASVHDF